MCIEHRAEQGRDADSLPQSIEICRADTETITSSSIKTYDPQKGLRPGQVWKYQDKEIFRSPSPTYVPSSKAPSSHRSTNHSPSRRTSNHAPSHKSSKRRSTHESLSTSLARPPSSCGHTSPVSKHKTTPTTPPPSQRSDRQQSPSRRSSPYGTTWPSIPMRPRTNLEWIVGPQGAKKMREADARRSSYHSSPQSSRSSWNKNGEEDIHSRVSNNPSNHSRRDSFQRSSSISESQENEILFDHGWEQSQSNASATANFERRSKASSMIDDREPIDIFGASSRQTSPKASSSSHFGPKQERDIRGYAEPGEVSIHPLSSVTSSRSLILPPEPTPYKKPDTKYSSPTVESGSSSKENRSTSRHATSAHAETIRTVLSRSSAATPSRSDIQRLVDDLNERRTRLDRIDGSTRSDGSYTSERSELARSIRSDTRIANKAIDRWMTKQYEGSQPSQSIRKELDTSRSGRSRHGSTELRHSVSKASVEW